MYGLLADAMMMGASDLHLVVGSPPLARVHGSVTVMDHPSLSAAEVEAMVLSLTTEAQREELAREWQLCFSRTIEGIGYVRVSAYYHRRRLEAAVRLGRDRIPTPEELGLPEVLGELARRPNGLLLITGPTGSGKTTTLNSIIDGINRERRAKIVMVEDPIEYVHQPQRSIVVQQEVGTDTKSFGRALVHILRQDPDVIGIGEMRDLETISAALTAAETGHLVIATLHANDCPSAINRVVDVFPREQQEQVRFQLSMSLRAIMTQRLVARADGRGRVLAYGLLVANTAVQTIVRENRLSQLVNVMQSGRREGMQVMDDMLRDLYQRAVISYDAALSEMTDPKSLVRRGT